MKKVMNAGYITAYGLLLTLFFGVKRNLILKDVLLVLGVLNVAIIALFVVKQKTEKKAIRNLIILVCLYVVMFGVRFQTKTLMDFWPDDFTPASSMHIVYRGDDQNYFIVWMADDGPLKCVKETDGYHEVVGGNLDAVYEQAGKIVVRNYWWPGGVDSLGKGITLTGESQGVMLNLMLRNYEGDLQISYLENGRSEGRTGHWLAYDDIWLLVPKEVLEVAGIVME